LAALAITGDKEDKVPAVDTTKARAVLLPAGTTMLDDGVKRYHAQTDEGTLIVPTEDNRVKHNLPAPVLDPKDPFMTLRRLDVWHTQVTDRELYKNACGTH
jgi:hypothetical protein